MSSDKKPRFEARFLEDLGRLNAGIEELYAEGPSSFVLFAVQEVKAAHQDYYTCCPYPVALLKRLFRIAGERVPYNVAQSDVASEVMEIAEMDRLTAKCQVRLCLR